MSTWMPMIVVTILIALRILSFRSHHLTRDQWLTVWIFYLYLLAFLACTITPLSFDDQMNFSISTQGLGGVHMKLDGILELGFFLNMELLQVK